MQELLLTLTGVASVAKSALNRPDLSADQVHSLVNRYTRILYIFPFLRLPFPSAALPRRVLPLGHKGSQRQARSIGSRDWTRAHEGIGSLRNDGKSVGPSIRLRRTSLHALARQGGLCRSSICYFARDTRERGEGGGRACIRKSVDMHAE